MQQQSASSSARELEGASGAGEPPGLVHAVAKGCIPSRARGCCPQAARVTTAPDAVCGARVALGQGTSSEHCPVCLSSPGCSSTARHRPTAGQGQRVPGSSHRLRGSAWSPSPVPALESAGWCGVVAG